MIIVPSDYLPPRAFALVRLIGILVSHVVFFHAPQRFVKLASFCCVTSVKSCGMFGRSCARSRDVVIELPYTYFCGGDNGVGGSNSLILRYKIFSCTCT